MAKTVGFSIAEKDTARLERLVKKFGAGNRSAFLREAMTQMEAVDRAQRLQRLQRIGAGRSLERGRAPESVNDIVRKVLGKRHR
jgi:Arc/MetJ-type ribon-helix-helix transcriptional regulator